MAAPRVGTATPGEQPGKPTKLRLQLDAETLRRALAEGLEEYCFERVTLLEAEDEAAAAIAAAATRTGGVASAAAAGADLLLELELRYDPEVFRGSTGVFWLNWPLFFVMTPIVWILPDNIYFADIELTAQIYDLNALAGAGPSAPRRAARVIAVSSRFNGSEIKFLDRTSTFKQRVVGLVWPSGYLSRESKDVAVTLEQRVVEALCAQVARDMQGRQDELVQAEHVSPLHIDPEVLLERVGDEVHVSGLVHVRHAGSTNGIRSIRLDAGAGSVFATPLTRDVRADVTTVTFATTVALASDAEFLRLECEAGTRERYFRSYTFRLPETPAPASVAELGARASDADPAHN